jgi:Calcineurin-like phosphoesterase
MFSILHISDLHRSRTEPISNAELISALVSDRDSYLHEDPPIAPPQAIVVSGDIIQGVRLGHAESGTELEAQYDTAHEFLVQLADRFVDGDRSKVVLIPGNHDIDWNLAHDAMEKVDERAMPDLPYALYEPGSPYRWDWKSRQLYVIKNELAYRQRLAAFWRFFDRFYSKVPGLLRVGPWSDANLYSLDNGRIGVAAFNSCTSNDCFSLQGEVPRELVAQAHLDLKALGPWRLRISVWHHDIEGPPNRSDYMDPEIVRGMIGRGFRLGLYGHQHRPQITPQYAYLPDRETMAITSAGSLCAGRHELPTGARRGYSVIEVADDYQGARIHVREMAFANLFSRANLPTFGGRSYVDLEWTTPVDAAGRPEDPSRERRAAVIRQAEAALLEQQKPAEALQLLSALRPQDDSIIRQLTLSAARKVGDLNKIIEATGEPESIEELVLGVDARLSQLGPEAADAFLVSHAARLEVPAATQVDLRSKIELMQRAKS